MRGSFLLSNGAIFLITMMLLSGLSFAEDNPTYALICNKDVPVTELDVKTIQSVFLGKTSKIADEGQDKVKVNLSIHKEGAVHADFLKACIQKTESQFNTYWKKQVFSGKATMPKSFKTDKEVVDYVAKTKGGLGYVSVETLSNTELMNDNVKVIKIKK